MESHAAAGRWCLTGIMLLVTNIVWLWQCMACCSQSLLQPAAAQVLLKSTTVKSAPHLGMVVCCGVP